MGDFPSSSRGLLALFARISSRRLTYHWATEPSIGLGKSDANVVLNKDLRRSRHSTVPEAKEMARRRCWQTSIMREEKDVSLSIDATRASGKDVVSCAVRLPRRNVAFWMSAQAACSRSRVCVCVCSQSVDLVFAQRC